MKHNINYRIHRWYDDLDRGHGVLRFLIFMAILSVVQVPYWLSSEPMALLMTVIGFGLLALSRLLYFVQARYIRYRGHNL